MIHTQRRIDDITMCCVIFAFLMFVEVRGGVIREHISEGSSAKEEALAQAPVDAGPLGCSKWTYPTDCKNSYEQNPFIGKRRCIWVDEGQPSAQRNAPGQDRPGFGKAKYSLFRTPRRPSANRSSSGSSFQWLRKAKFGQWTRVASPVKNNTMEARVPHMVSLVPSITGYCSGIVDCRDSTAKKSMRDDPTIGLCCRTRDGEQNDCGSMLGMDQDFGHSGQRCFGYFPDKRDERDYECMYGDYKCPCSGDCTTFKCQCGPDRDGETGENR